MPNQHDRPRMPAWARAAAVVMSEQMARLINKWTYDGAFLIENILNALL